MGLDDATAVPTGNFTARPWKNGQNPGGVVVVQDSGKTALQTVTALASQTLGQSILAVPGVMPVTPPPSTSKVLRYLRVAIASAASFSDMSAEAADLDVVVVQPWETSFITALKAANPKVTVLIYINFGAMTSAGVTDGFYPALPLNSAWALQNASGGLVPVDNQSGIRDEMDRVLRRAGAHDGGNIPIAGYSWLWLADVGLAAYWQAWAAFAIKQAIAAGADGVFADNTDLSCSGSSTPPKYPNDAAYQAAMQTGLAGMFPLFTAAGKMLVPNFGSWASYPTVGNAWLSVVHGAMDEQFVKWGTTAGVGFRGAQQILQQISSVQTANQLGKLFLGVTHSADGDGTAANVGAAAMILGGGGAYCFSSPPEYAAWSLPPDAPAIAALGAPSGTHTVEGDVVSQAFANGAVELNAAPAIPVVSIS